MSEVVALLLDDAMPPARLGTLLRGARKRRGLSRKQAAAAAGTTAGKLRSYERGEKPVPAEICSRLAECYGDELSAHVPLRVVPMIEHLRIEVGGTEQTVGPEPDDVVAGYVDIVQRLRNCAPGDPLALRTVDIIAFAGALGSDRDEIEQRIAMVLGCSRAEAHELHNDLLRRKVILPVAGLAAGMAAFAGAAYAAQPTPVPSTVQIQPIVATAPPSTTPAPLPSDSRPAARPAAATPSTAAAVTTPTTAAPQTDATVPPAQQAADVPVSVAPPQADPSDPPVSILPGETPITIIGTPDSTSNTP